MLLKKMNITKRSMKVSCLTNLDPESIVSADIDLCDVITTGQIYSAIQCVCLLSFGILIVS